MFEERPTIEKLLKESQKRIWKLDIDESKERLTKEHLDLAQELICVAQKLEHAIWFALKQEDHETSD